jgi:ABC-type cobalamin/Fe3+-siderophores transport system ATPase subunit
MTNGIKIWLNGQTLWLQAAAHRLLTNGSLADTDIADFVQLIKSPPTTRPTFEYPNIGGATTATEELRINSIGPVTGIDALNPRTPLLFTVSNLSIVYGANGSGKSGYIRILKKAAGKAGAVDLKSNVYKPRPVQQTCTLSFKQNEEDQEVTWTANSTPINALTSIDIFDAHCGDIYLKSETELSYTPPELVLFENLVDASKRVAAVLKVERDQLTSKLPRLTNKFTGTDHANFYNALTHSITTESLAEVLLWTPELEINLAAQKKRLETKDPKAESKKKLQVQKQLGGLKISVTTSEQAVNPTSIKALRALISDAGVKRKASKEGATVLAGQSNLEGVGGETWKSLWLAAQTYSTAEAYTPEPYPNLSEGARCVLCQQKLSDEAKARYKTFDDYIKGKLEQDAVKAEETLKKALEALPNIPSEENLQTRAQAANLGDELSPLFISYCSNVKRIVASLNALEMETELPDISEQATALIVSFETCVRLLGEQIEQLKKDAEGFDRTAAQKDLLEIECKKWITDQAEAVRTEWARLKKLECYRLWLKQTGATGISIKAGALSESLITAAYIKRFNDELVELGADHISVELHQTRTAAGRSKHAIRLRNLTATNTNPADILSEGEHRVVALAAFLADVTSSPTKTPFIFDDPITSLDQDYEENCIDRLIKLSADRQVLIFTHRLSFLSIVRDKKKSANCINIRQTASGTGDHGLIPYFKKNAITALNTIKDQILPPAKRQFEDENIESYHIQAKGICSEFRIQLEHIVESVLISDVIKRHRRSVTTKDRINNLSKITFSDCRLIEDMMTKYSCYEHSQSGDTSVETPDPDEIETDIATILTWYNDDFKNRPLMSNGVEVIDL